MAEGKVEQIDTTANDWQINKSLNESLKYLLENDIASDIKFTVGINDEKRRIFRAHKLILASRSPVFYKMFIGEGGENKDNDSIIVTDCDPKGFDVMLKYIYHDTIDINESNVFHVLETSEKYTIPTLQKRATEIIHECIVPHKICGVLDQAVFYHKEELINLGLWEYSKTPDTALSSQSFQNISFRTLLKILRTENVPLTELTLFQACERWATQECKRRNLEDNGPSKRKCLDEALYYIRFPRLSIDYFGNYVSMKGILSEQEELSVVRYLMKNDKTHASQDLVFRYEEREKDVTFNGNAVSRFDIVNGKSSQRPGTQELTFKANKRVAVVGFRSQHFAHTATFKIYGTCDGKQLFQQQNILGTLKEGLFFYQAITLDADMKKTFSFNTSSSQQQKYNPHYPYRQQQMPQPVTEGGINGKGTATGEGDVIFTFDQPDGAAFIDEILYFEI